jgi:hypothetical protein
MRMVGILFFCISHAERCFYKPICAMLTVVLGFRVADFVYLMLRSHNTKAAQRTSLCSKLVEQPTHLLQVW